MRPAQILRNSCPQKLTAMLCMQLQGDGYSYAGVFDGHGEALLISNFA